MITSCDPIIFRPTKHWTAHRSPPPPLLDIDVVKVVAVPSFFGVGELRRVPFSAVESLAAMYGHRRLYIYQMCAGSRGEEWR